jgi:predicted dehydrogenase
MNPDPHTRILKFGVLGAAKITPQALILPARKITGIEIRAVAARDWSRAERFAAVHAIPVTHQDYAELLADPEINVIYNPLPNSLHCEWSIKALDAGKHVLCEKPIASNAIEAQHMSDAARKSRRVLCEAFHYRYHPLAARMKAIVESGELGTIVHIEAHLNTTVLNPRDIRFSFDLAGGALMDTGSYTVNILRFLGGAEPVVLRARAKCLSPQIDRWMEADFRFADGRTGRITCSLLSSVFFRWQARVIGELGEMQVVNPIRPHRHHSITVVCQGTTRQEHVVGDTTFTHQLKSFAEAVRTGHPVLTDDVDAVANMKLIDSIYCHAGLKPRGT